MSNELAQIRETLGAINDASVLIGVVVAVLLFSKRQLESSYEKLNDKFLEFLQLQISHPGLGTNTTDRAFIALTDDPKSLAVRDLIFDFLCSLLERAYLFLGAGIDQYLPWKAREWKHWEKWIIEYGKNENFREFWNRVSGTCCYSESFVRYMNHKMNG